MNSKLSLKSLLALVALLVVISGCASLHETYETATRKFDAVSSTVGTARGVVYDVGSAKEKVKRITGK